jgi:single-stranded DNA-binding protein
MAKGTAFTAWFKTPKWYESRTGEVVEQDKSDYQCCFWMGVGVVIIPSGFEGPFEVKQFTRKDGSEGMLVKAVLALYNGNYETLIRFGPDEVTNTMTTLEEGNIVFVIGKQKRSEYVNKKGQNKVKTELWVSFILPQGHVNAVEDMFMNPNIQAVMEGRLLNAQPGAADYQAGEEPEGELESAMYDNDAYESESDFDPDSDEFESLTSDLPFV